MKAKFAWLVAISSIFIGVTVFLYHDTMPVEKKQNNVPAISTSKAAFSEIVDSIQSIGSVVSNESVNITSTVTKKVVEVNFLDGEYVKKGDLLVRLDSSLEDAEEKRLELNLNEQEREFERLKPLKKTGVASEKVYETQMTKMLSARAELEAVRAKINETYITAPFDGILGMRSVSVGSLVTAGTLITTIDSIKTVKVDFSVPEKYVLKVKLGNKITATSEASKDRKFFGQIIAVSPRIDDVSHNVLIRGNFDNDDLLLRPGMILKLDILLEKRRGICVPETALLNVGDKQFIFKIVNGKPYKSNVTVGSRFFGQVEIISGLCEGEEYVTDGIISIVKTKK